MNPATLIVTGLMAMPPTWGKGQIFPLEHAAPHIFNVPTIPDSLVRLQEPPTAISLSQAGSRYIALESTEAARRVSLEKLQNRVVEIRMNPLPDSDEAQREQIRLAAEITTKLISEIPNNLPMPKVMPLLSQISLYWDFGETYAELAISGSGQLSIYGRQPGKTDVLVDTSFADLRASGLLFPADLDKILITA